MLCQEKNKYSKSSADKTARKIREREGISLRVYKCNTCNSYHLTHKGKWLKKYKAHK